MNSIKKEAGGFEKVVFESVIDTLAGGTSLDVTGYVNADGVIPAGTPVGPKNASTGLSAIITNSGGTPSATPIGYVHHTVPLVANGNNLVGVVIEGVMRAAAMPAGYTSALGALRTATPKVTIV
ncbi:MAG TPA: hypothetical protein VEZ55_06925 [Chitinophagaceae bacterium]|nr:hypothetical protein [Chitinophagaceae bacterium]